MAADQYIGIDVGGTKIVAASFVAGGITNRTVAPTVLSSTEALLDQIVAMVEAVRLPEARAVGIGVPSVVEFATGRIRFSVNIPLADVPLRALLSDRLGLPVFVENDASCAALAEAHEGGDIVSPYLVMFTIGTGVGGGLVLGGRLFRGATGAAPELGHMIVGMDFSRPVPAPAERFPQPWSLEAVASGSALDALALGAAGRGWSTGREVAAAAATGDPDGVGLIRALGERLGVGIANAINVFDPFEVVVGGGVSAAGELLLAPAREVASRFTLPGVGTRTVIRIARTGAEAGVIGAALLALHEQTLVQEVR